MNTVCLNVRMPLYGRGFTLNNAADNGFYAPANQPIPAGPYTREAGILGFNEVIDILMRITVKNIKHQTYNHTKIQ